MTSSWTKMLSNVYVCIAGPFAYNPPITAGFLASNAEQASIALHDDDIKWKHFRVTGHLCREFIGPRWIPHKKASDAELWCFLWSAPNKRLSKQWWGWWFETPSYPLWRHRAGDFYYRTPWQINPSFQWELAGVGSATDMLCCIQSYRMCFSSVINYSEQLVECCFII